MSRLKTLGARLGASTPGLGAAGKRADPFYSSPEWRALAASVKAARGGWCCIPGCETPGDRVAADHVKEVRDGGAPLDPKNLQLLCHAHHMTKTAAARTARAGLA
jgi:hypothetical protein